MDLKRAFLAVVLSLAILTGYQYFMVKFGPKPPAAPPVQQEAPAQARQQAGEVLPAAPAPATPAATGSQTTVSPDPSARDITVDTPLYTAVFKEQGGGLKSFVLKNYRSKIESDSGPMQLVSNGSPATLPLLFSLDNGVSLITYKADRSSLALTEPGAKAALTMTATLADGLQVVRTLTFRGDSYLIGMDYTVHNDGEKPVQISPALTLDHEPFPHVGDTSMYLFAGPTTYANGELVETKPKKLEEAPVVLQGKVSWTGFADSYFMASVVPPPEGMHTVTLQGTEKHMRTVISEGIQSLAAKQGVSYAYTLYFGPKKLKILQASGFDLAKAVDFGWFDVLAKPMLWLLNFFHQYSGNYGIAIILLTVLIKLVFWPVTQKGMQSMKNMQKLQPKVAKLRERFKDDPSRMNQEMMTLYKTYKVNPVGGCLPMLIQIPFFFALYRVLMASIELRHAPFALWINDLSAPDRLWVGFDIPYLHGLPVLTLLMGVSMYLQQKMTPTTADPAQARIMQFLPVVFTFMFINFASGLVLYWFVNNLLSMLQQYLINRKNIS